MIVTIFAYLGPWLVIDKDVADKKKIQMVAHSP
jgi:hypothetical protein